MSRGEGGGRPTKYKAEFCVQAAKLCALGATDAQIADFFEVDEATINRWKQEHPRFCESLKNAKSEHDEKVERSLYERAMGYSHKSEKIFCQEGEVIRAETVEHYPPDPTSMIFWLKNRQPKKWRDKQEHELSGKDGAPVPVLMIGKPETK
jgi:hypothetical protein